MHMGTANSGHYYSYIRPRDGDGEWLEFNDTIVSTFDTEVSSMVDLCSQGCFVLSCFTLKFSTILERYV